MSEYFAAAVVSIFAAGSLDHFFVEPVFSFRVTNPLNILALVSFLITALVITRLVSQVGAEARLARLQAERLDHLYRLAQQLLALEPDVAVGQTFLEIFAGVFGTTAVCLFDSDTAVVDSIGDSKHGLADKTRQAFLLGHDMDDSASNVSIRCLRVAGEVTGAMGFEGLENPESTAGPVTALAAAATQTEVYRSAILDALAHEFKTPLATILAAADGVREAGQLNRQQGEMADTVESEAARLGSLTSRLLRVARLDREEVKPRMEVTDVNPLLAQLVEQYSRPPSDRKFSMASPGRSFEVLADPELLRLAVSQLLDNACKYSLPGSAVKIDVQRQGDLIAVRVSNNGASIPSNEQSRIFERFYRGTAARRFTSGSGFARKIALAHGGGTKASHSAWRYPRRKASPNMSLPSVTVLVVDDESPLRKALRGSLTASGFTAEQARSGEEAVDMVQQRSFDVVLLDMNMPGMGGLGACRRIRGVTPNAGIVIVTVPEAEDDKVNALEAGADDHVTKPFQMRELIARLRAVLRRTHRPGPNEDEVLRAFDLVVNLQHRSLLRSGKPIRLSPKEFDLLALMMRNKDLPLTHVKMLRTIWGPEYGGELEYLRAYIRMLRKKIEENPDKPVYIVTKPWVAYRFCEPSDPDVALAPAGGE